MADNRIIISEMVIKNSPANTAEVDKVDQHFQRMAKAASDGSKIMETATTQSSARIKANFDRIVASLDPLDAAMHRIEQAYQRDLRGIELARRKSQASEEQYTAALTRLTNKRIEDIAREKTARLQAEAGGINDNSRNARAAGLNAAFQFQDIGMMAIAGQNPLMTAVQQGTQLAGILAQVETKGGSVLKTLGAGLAGIFSWQSMLAIGLTGLATLAIQYAMAWATAGDETKRTLDEQNKGLEEVVEKHGIILTALREINELRTKEAEAAKVAQVTDEQRAAAYQKYSQQFQEIRLQVASQSQLLIGTPEGTAISAAYGNLSTEFENLTASGKDVNPVIDALRAAFGNTNQVVNDQIALLLKLRASLDVASMGTKKLTEQQEELGRAVNFPSVSRRGVPFGLVLPEEITTGPESAAPNRFDLQDRIDAAAAARQAAIRDARIMASEEARRRQINAGFLTEEGTVPLPDTAGGLEREEQRLEFQQEAAEAAEKAAKKEADALEKLRNESQRLFEAEQKRLEQARDFVNAQEDKAEAAELELVTMGMEEEARERLISQMKIEQELAKTNIVLTQAQADAVREYASRATEAKIQMNDNKEALSDLNDQQKFATDLGMDLFDAWIEGGKELTDVLKDIANALADAVLQAVLFGQGPLAGFFGTKPAQGFDIGGVVGTLLGNKAATGPSAGAVATQTTLAGTGWEGGLRNIGALGAQAFTPAGNVKLTGAQLVSVPFAGKMIQVDARYAGQFAALGENLAAAGYPVTSVGEGGYSHRKVAGTSSWSQHAYGQAVDVNPAQNRYAYGARGNWSQFNVNASRMAQDVGLEYGGDWRKPDTMHFQVSRNAEQAAANLAKFNQATGQATATTTSLAKSAGGATGAVGQFGDALSQFPAAPAAPGGAGGVGGLGNLFGGFFGGGAALSPSAWSWVSGGGGMTGLWARGGAFHGGNIIPFARGGIVDGPMLFPMARGAGLMGEAGPEAVMPLTRGANGKLGVAMSGGNTGVVIHNYSTAEVKPRENPDGRGGLEFVIEDRTADRINTYGTPLNKSVRNAAASRLKRR